MADINFSMCEAHSLLSSDRPEKKVGKVVLDHLPQKRDEEKLHEFPRIVQGHSATKTGLELRPWLLKRGICLDILQK